MRAKAVLESALYVDDLTRSESFYCDVLGLELIGRMQGRHVFLRCGEGVVLLFNEAATRSADPDSRLPVPIHGATGPGHLCFGATSEEMDEWIAILESHGVPIEADFIWPGGGRSIYFRDPSGNSLEFGERKIWGFE